MGTRFPHRLLYTMAVFLAVLTMLFLILSMALKIYCDGSSALYDADGLTGRIAYVCNGDIYRMDLATGEVARLSQGANYPWFDWSPDGEKIAWPVHEQS